MTSRKRRPTVPRSSTLTLSLLLLAGCSSSSDTGSAGVPNPEPNEPVASSPDPRLKFKGDVRLRNDLVATLALNAEELCTELGQFSCTDTVHKISLGGVSPYDLAFYQPLANTTVASPLAVDRVALHGCRERIDRDLADPTQAVLLQDVALTDAGLDPASSQASAFIDRLYKRAIQRPPTRAELSHLHAFYNDVRADSETPARDWALLSCFAVLTSTEFLFY